MSRTELPVLPTETAAGVDAAARSIARLMTISRAALSKALLNLRDQYSIKFTIGRLESAREIFRQAQLDAVKNGTHASRLVRKECSTRNLAMSPTENS